MNVQVIIALLFCLIATCATQKVKGSPEVLPAAMYDGELSHESVNKISAQLLNALSELEALQEGNQQLKMAEKRRNKFEFIRFGRK
ncbi:FMRF-Like Peptide [Caenorhabditis elegans]|uniref:FMRF-Like Peptide n=1 Tax=Caenorhabditis elegans TaxID=6239 RepID=G5EBV5_CAEEL|nr:FMRF-Like Peptide [Caenorhabditis elegans]AAC08950.1 FMRFamide-like peptide 12 [Caenorhabditis elegans]CCD63264.1 FMRF-Like Peptide [Caenorhabditis elegans]|eukprot:NP_508789.1 FMRF-Like Peptide [Caenorhabditis elegans]